MGSIDASSKRREHRGRRSSLCEGPSVSQPQPSPTRAPVLSGPAARSHLRLNKPNRAVREALRRCNNRRACPTAPRPYCTRPPLLLRPVPLRLPEPEAIIPVPTLLPPTRVQVAKGAAAPRAARAGVVVRAAVRSNWLPGSDFPAHLENCKLPGCYGFDPLGLGADPERLKWFAESERVHARWAMLGVAGILIQVGAVCWGPGRGMAVKPTVVPAAQRGRLQPAGGKHGGHVQAAVAV